MPNLGSYPLGQLLLHAYPARLKPFSQEVHKVTSFSQFTHGDWQASHVSPFYTDMLTGQVSKHDLL